MALRFANRVWCSTSTTGTGTISVGAAKPGYQAPSAAVVPSPSTIGYTLVDGSAFEVGIGTLTAGTPYTMSRDIVESSSAAGAKISLSGLGEMFITQTASSITGIAGFDTIAALRANTACADKVVRVAGYATVGDGGEGEFILAETDTTTANNNGTIVVDASGRRWYRDPTKGMVSVRWFGAKGDGSTDDTAAIQAAFAAAPVAEIYFPPGTYVVSSTITVGPGQFLVGSGSGLTTFKVMSSSSDVFVLSGSSPTSSWSWGGMSGFSIVAGVAQTGGRFIYDVAGFPTVVENFSMNGALIGIELATVICYYRNGSIRDMVASTGIAIRVTDGNEHFVNNIVIDNPIAQCAYGIQVVQSGGTYLSSISIIRSGIGVGLIPQNGNNVDWFSATDVLCDTCTGEGWLLECNGNGVIRGAVLENCWASSNGVGMYVDKVFGTIDTITLTNFRCLNNLGVGVNLASCSRWTQIGGYVASNSQIPLTTQAGLSVAAICDHVILKGIQFGGFPTLGDSQLDQIILGDGVDFVHIEGCNLTTSHTALAYATIGNNVTIRNNFGFVNEFRGTGQVPNGSTSNAIPHGLTVAPALADIMISPLTSMAAVGINSAWVSAIAVTTFTVSTNVAPSAPFFFAWSAKTAGAH